MTENERQVDPQLERQAEKIVNEIMPQLGANEESKAHFFVQLCKNGILNDTVIFRAVQLMQAKMAQTLESGKQLIEEVAKKKQQAPNELKKTLSYSS